MQGLGIMIPDNNLSCVEAFEECVYALRMGYEGIYARRLVQAMECVQKWLEKEPDKEGEVIHYIEEAMACQITHNNARLADILQYEIYPQIYGGSF